MCEGATLIRWWRCRGAGARESRRPSVPVNRGFQGFPCATQMQRRRFQLRSGLCCLFLGMFHENLFVALSRDGVPPYGFRKQHRREMHESAKANGRVPLPHIPVSYLRCLALSLHL